MTAFQNSPGGLSDSETTELERKLSSFGDALRDNVSLADRVIEDLAPTHHTRSGANSDYQGRISPFGEARMLKRITFGSVSAVLITGLVVWLTSATATVSFAQVVKSIAAAKNYSADFTITAEDGEGAGRLYWRAPGSHRVEHKASSQSLGEEDEIHIFSTHEPGIRINNVAWSFTREPAVQGRMSPLTSLQKLADYKGRASKSLGEKQIHGKACLGYEIPVAEIDENAGRGTVVIWVDAISLLPVECTYALQSADETIEMRFESFVWNQNFSDELFSADPPEGYTDATRPARSIAEQTESITRALSIYSRLADGGYPQATVIYGDVTRDRMLELAGFTGDDLSQYFGEDNYGLIMEAGVGFATMNQIMSHNPDAAYHGLTVTPADKNEILFRWKLEDGDYQVIYGDLRTARESE